MRIMTIAARHEALVHTMLEWQIKLRADVGMALVTDVGLALGQQVLGRFRIVNGMAGGASDIMLGVFGAPDVGAAELVGMAGETEGNNFRRFHSAESVDDCVHIPARVHMRLSRTVA